MRGGWPGGGPRACDGLRLVCRNIRSMAERAVVVVEVVPLLGVRHAVDLHLVGKAR